MHAIRDHEVLINHQIRGVLCIFVRVRGIADQK